MVRDWDRTSDPCDVNAGFGAEPKAFCVPLSPTCSPLSALMFLRAGTLYQ